MKEHNTGDSVNYNGLTENTFKERFYKYRNTLNYESKANSTELSKNFWEMKRKGIEKKQLRIGQLLIMPNHTRKNQKDAIYA